MPFNRMTGGDAGGEQLASAAEELSAAVQELSGAAAEILTAIDQISKGAQVQAAATQESTAAMAQIGSRRVDQRVCLQGRRKSERFGPGGRDEQRRRITAHSDS